MRVKIEYIYYFAKFILAIQEAEHCTNWLLSDKLSLFHTHTLTYTQKVVYQEKHTPPNVGAVGIKIFASTILVEVIILM